MNCRALLGLALCALVPVAASAQEAPALPLWELGAFGMTVSQQAYPGAGQQLQRNLLLPYVVYRGDLLRVGRGGVELRKMLAPNVEVDLGFAAAFGGSSDEIEARRGMPDLGTLLEAGPRIRWTLHEGADHSQLRAVLAWRSVLDANDQLRDKGTVLEPQLIYTQDAPGPWQYSVSGALLFGDERLADTLYGVAPRYATATRSSYTARAGLIATRLAFYLSRRLTPDLRISTGARIDSVAGAANQDSPLVQKTAGATVGVWLTYTFAKSDTLVRE